MAKFDDLTKKVSALYREEEEELIKALSLKYGHPYINLFGIVINTEALRLVSEETARKAECAIFMRAGTKLSVALRNPNKQETRDLLASLASREFSLTTYMASSTSLEHAFERYHDVVDTSASERGVLGITAAEIDRMTKELKTVRDVYSS